MLAVTLAINLFMASDGKMAPAYHDMLTSNMKPEARREILKHLIGTKCCFKHPILGFATLFSGDLKFGHNALYIINDDIQLRIECTPNFEIRAVYYEMKGFDTIEIEPSFWWGS